MIGAPRPEMLWQVVLLEDVGACSAGEDIPSHEAGHLIVSLSVEFPAAEAIVDGDSGYMSHLPGGVKLWKESKNKGTTETDHTGIFLTRNAEKEWPKHRVSVSFIDAIAVCVAGLQGEFAAKNDKRIMIYRNDSDHRKALAIAKRYLPLHRIPAYSIRLARWLIEQNVEAHEFATQMLLDNGRITDKDIPTIENLLKVRGKSRLLPEFVSFS